MTKAYSYSFDDHIRDLGSMLHIIEQIAPILWALFPVRKKKPTARKIEFYKTVLSSLTSALTAQSLSGSTNIEIADSSIFKVGDVLSFEATDGSFISEYAYVDALVDATNITVTRGYDSTTRS